MRGFSVIVCVGLAGCGGEAVEVHPQPSTNATVAKPRVRSDRGLVHFSVPGVGNGAHTQYTRRDFQTTAKSVGQPELTTAEQNERLVVSALEQLVFAQHAAVYHKYVDADSNGRGEPLALAELLGVASVRGSERRFEGNRELLSRFEQRLTRGRGRHAGYFFEVWLRGPGGEWSTTAPDGVVSEWRCFAWPVNRGVSGRLAYYVDHSGEILATMNINSMYSGHEITPQPDAATGERLIAISAHAGDAYMGADGARWRRVSVYVPPSPAK